MTAFVPPGITAEVAAERGYRRIENTRQLTAYSHTLTEKQQQTPGLLVPIYRLGETTVYTWVL